ncbi:hypothetical protein Ctob_001384 [Chrysochromulina tobinii]|uniref:Uncharacterized protein n=1 Tax=Chrysochromulina tobinii TaxID=1460289 RepID=A0A0M0JI53_9EUKA|nr:hypothetical protein Ctob_001384 [Chrysochromulina tobinii]|eukprot:KOO26291.1 hypothetical protein Ctob_001384 [Chrysochromulina sp. CCMP291]
MKTESSKGTWKIKVRLDDKEKPETLQAEKNYKRVEVALETGDVDDQQADQQADIAAAPPAHVATFSEDTTVNFEKQEALEMISKVLQIRPPMNSVEEFQSTHVANMVKHIEDCIKAFRVVRQLQCTSGDDGQPDNDTAKLLDALRSKLFLPEEKEMEISVSSPKEVEVGVNAPTDGALPSASKPWYMYPFLTRKWPNGAGTGNAEATEDNAKATVKSTPQSKAKIRPPPQSDVSTYYLTHDVTDDDGEPDPRIVPVMVEADSYKSGADCSLRRVPWTQKDMLNPAVDPLLKEVPRWDPKSEKVRVGKDRLFTQKEWVTQLEKWQAAYPNVTKPDGSNPFETAAFRTKKTSDDKIIEATFNALPAFGSPTWGEYNASWGKSTKALLSMFRPDMWGNMVCLPDKIDPLGATNGSLCFFDVDHLFPFSRGGQSIKDNFAAVQCVANRYIKGDNLIPYLNPVQMACGISSKQLVAMVLSVEKNSIGELRSRKDQNSLRDRMLTWLTRSSIKGESFRTFQADVRRSTDGQTLVNYFRERQRREDEALLGRVEPRSADRCLTVRIIKCMLRLEVRGQSTYYVQLVQDRLKSAKYWWDNDNETWAKELGSQTEKEDLLKNLRDLAREYGFRYTELTIGN